MNYVTDPYLILACGLYLAIIIGSLYGSLGYFKKIRASVSSYSERAFWGLSNILGRSALMFSALIVARILMFFLVYKAKNMNSVTYGGSDFNYYEAFLLSDAVSFYAGALAVVILMVICLIMIGKSDPNATPAQGPSLPVWSYWLLIVLLWAFPIAYISLDLFAIIKFLT